MGCDWYSFKSYVFKGFECLEIDSSNIKIALDVLNKENPLTIAELMKFFLINEDKIIEKDNLQEENLNEDNNTSQDDESQDDNSKDLYEKIISKLDKNVFHYALSASSESYGESLRYHKMIIYQYESIVSESDLAQARAGYDDFPIESDYSVKMIGDKMVHFSNFY